jgi:drug/metabolite transporter (DMT)-like permease
LSVANQSWINRRGMFAMTGATAGFAINDAMMKHLVVVMPLSQSVVLRGLVTIALAFAILLWQGHGARLGDIWRREVILRAVLEAAVVITYMQALREIPLGLATAILQATPLMMTACAAVIGRETVGMARWLAVIIGFAGVMMIVQPDAQGISPAMALAVLTAVFVTARDLSNRIVPPHVPLFTIVLAASIANVASGAAFSLGETEPWRMPDLFETLLTLGAALFVLASTALITTAFRGTEVSAVSPFRYVGVPVALVIGAFAWGETPNLLAGAGIVLVIGAGLFAMQDEARRARLAPPSTR